jgi:hypothetical protein
VVAYRSPAGRDLALDSSLLSAGVGQLAVVLLLEPHDPRPLALLGRPLAFIRAALAFVGEHLSTVGDAVALVSHPVALLGDTFPSGEVQFPDREGVLALRGAMRW